MSHVTCHMSHVICQMLMLILGTCWTTFVLMSKLKSEYLWLCHMLHVTCRMSHVTCHIAHVTCHMSNAYVDPWNMQNNFCFHVYAQKWVFVIMSHVACRMSHVKCLCWSLGHADFFSCLCSNVAVFRWKWQCFFLTGPIIELVPS